MPTRRLVTRYEDDLRLFPDLWHKVGLSLIVPFLLAFPFLADGRWLTVGNLAMVHVVGAIGLMILTGFAGQISLGHAAFLAVGAYTVSTLGEHLGVPFWLALPAAGCVSTAVGLLVGPFALRLKGLYLAIITLGLLFIVDHTLLAFSGITGGVSGMNVPMYVWFPAEGAPPWEFSSTTELFGLALKFEQKLYFLFLVLAVAATWMSKNLARSNTGRALVAVRDHDLAAAVLGVNPAKAKIKAFGISSFLAGIAGGMFAFQQQYITVSPPFDLNMSIQFIAIIVIGGMGTTFGAVVGALFFVTFGPLAEEVGKHIPLVNQLTSAQQSTLLFAIVVCVFLLFEPLGLTGLWLRTKRYFATWPFRY